MKIKKNGVVIRLTESDLKRIVKRVVTEQNRYASFDYKPPIDLKINNENEISDHIWDLIPHDEDNHHSFLENLAEYSHIEFDPSSGHWHLTISHMGKTKRVKLDIDGSFGHDYHHDSDTINLDLNQTFGIKLTLPLIHDGKRHKFSI